MQYGTIEEIFQAFENTKALIVGDVMVDAYIWGKVERISPEAPVPVVRAEKRDFRLGGAANVALNVQAMGATPVLCALVGNDAGGGNFADRMAANGLGQSGIVTSPDRPTTVKTRVIAGNHHIVRVDEESDRPATSEEESLLIEKISQLLSECQVVVFEDYDKGTLTERVITETIQKAQALGVPTVVDPKKRNFLAYKGVTLFKPNMKELKEGLKLEFDTTDHHKVEEAVDALIAALACDGALVTMSEQGVFIKNQSERHHLAAHVREIADVSGAGDTVISIAGLCVALGLPAYLTAALSNLGGGLVCEHVGVVPINRHQLKREALRHRLPHG